MARTFFKWIGPGLKPGLFYEVLAYDKSSNSISLRCRNGVELTTRFHGTDLANKEHYQLVTEEE